ncbi:anti-sigma factor [Microbacterium hominis]|uniref:Anti-sigma factor n=1 Tax=Microbacterium hominis TaxID=162426 RepID=A0A7D4UCC9_9MICO|nr:anti-sigma factor [Microbacterium hominis]QKJ20563.1 anti-sigma factor [Microbacterium hominis]
MSHLDPEQMALLALGESVASLADCAHLRSCPACAAELAELQETVQVARTVVADGDLESPPDRVWGAIADELGIDPAHPAQAPAEAPPTTAADDDAAPRRGRMRTMWALAASLVLVAGVGIGAWVVTSSLSPASIATAALDPFPDHPGATGTADVEESRDGARRLVVTVGSDAVPDTYREVWLIRNDAGALISLGVLEGDTGSFAIPDGVDLAEYSLVDVSVEPIDGDPAHSGDSIVRGELDQV